MEINDDSSTNQVLGTIFNIERYTLHDGPGIRTTVFFKGCPLKCLWCSNPESQKLNTEIVYFIEKCTGCGRCLEFCTQNALLQKSEHSPIKILYDLCNSCGLCTEQCYSEALTIAGKSMTADDVYEIVARDKLFYKHSNGGVTLSGGEPIIQSEFSTEILRLCKKNGIHTAIQTCGYASISNLERLLPYVDLFIYEIKHMDESEHKHLTGSSNKRILQNLHFLNKNKKNIVIQLALIPGFNDSQENLEAVFDLGKSLSSVEGLSLLSYHTLGVGKYPRIGREYKLPNLSQASAEYLEEKMIYAENHGVPLVKFN